MKIAPLPKNESQRLAALESYLILDSEAEAAYDDMVELVSFVCKTPIALISLIDTERQWFKAKVGLKVVETERDVAFCAHAILSDVPMIVEDTMKDNRFADNPLVTGNPKIRFYAGVPLRNSQGFNFGTLCVIDREPRTLDAGQIKALEVLARQTMVQMELRRQKKAITALSESKNRLFTLLSHDLRSPFNTIVGFTRELHRYIQSQNWTRVCETGTQIEKSAENVLKLVDDLLQWSKIETGSVRFEPEPLYVEACINDALSLVADMANEKEQTLKVETGSTGQMVNADSRLVRSILLNILCNAVKFTPHSGHISLHARTLQDTVSISVKDSGVGMTPDVLESLFNVNLQSSEGTDGESGTGFGLLLARGFARQNGGDLAIRSEPGQGTEISISLPLYTA